MRRGTERQSVRQTTASPDRAGRPVPPAVRALYGTGRVSAQRAVIADAVLASPGAFTAEELHRSLAERAEGVGLATVYRALAAMQSAGSIAHVGARAGSTLLARCERGDHHHHLVCMSCAGVVGIDCPLGEAALAAAAGAGHLVVRHEITIYGVCADCRTRDGDA